MKIKNNKNQKNFKKNKGSALVLTIIAVTVALLTVTTVVSVSVEEKPRTTGTKTVLWMTSTSAPTHRAAFLSTIPGVRKTVTKTLCTIIWINALIHLLVLLSMRGGVRWTAMVTGCPTTGTNAPTPRQTWMWTIPDVPETATATGFMTMLTCAGTLLPAFLSMRRAVRRQYPGVPNSRIMEPMSSGMSSLILSIIHPPSWACLNID